MIKRRLNPNKVLVLMLYSLNLPFVTKKGNGRVRIKTGEFARYIRVPNARLKEYVRFLETAKLVSDVEMYHGYIEMTILFPRLFEDEYEPKAKND